VGLGNGFSGGYVLEVLGALFLQVVGALAQRIEIGGASRKGWRRDVFCEEFGLFGSGLRIRGNLTEGGGEGFGSGGFRRCGILGGGWEREAKDNQQSPAKPGFAN